MARNPGTQRTLVGNIDPQVLDFTAGKDAQLDLALAEADCIGTAAHVTMLAALDLAPPLFTPAEREAVVAELLALMRRARAGKLSISPRDQDIHLAVERHVTRALGAAGRKMHTARSRNDQVALDLRLFTRERLLNVMEDAMALATALLRLARRHAGVPMVGRTHLQPAMPSSVGLWASSYAESLLDDMIVAQAACDLNNRCPLGSAAGYGVPLDIDRAMTSRLLGFAEPVHNVLHAANARGKVEAAVLAALGQIMITLSRLSADLILYAMPEFGYFRLPPDLCTGSSIMPQKQNPDVLELVRARASRVLAAQSAAGAILTGLPGGYSRDVQETKEPLLEGLALTGGCVRILGLLVPRVTVNRRALEGAFTPSVFAADAALERAVAGEAFRDVYRHVKKHLGSLAGRGAAEALAAKRHLGAPAGLDLQLLDRRARTVRTGVRRTRRRYCASIARLLGVNYPSLAP